MKLLSYNVLADCLAVRQFGAICGEAPLAWETRWPKLQRTILDENADIICISEADRVADSWLPFLTAQGYDAVFEPRTLQRYGTLLAWRRADYELLAHASAQLDDLARAIHYAPSASEAEAWKAPGEDGARFKDVHPVRLFSNTCIGKFAALRRKATPPASSGTSASFGMIASTASGAASSSSSSSSGDGMAPGSWFVFCGSHLYWEGGADHVRAAQAAMLQLCGVEFARHVERSLSGRPAPAGTMPAPMIITGDLNAPAGSLGFVALAGVPLPLGDAAGDGAYLAWDSTRWGALGFQPNDPAHVHPPAAAPAPAAPATTGAAPTAAGASGGGFLSWLTGSSGKGAPAGGGGASSAGGVAAAAAAAAAAGLKEASAAGAKEAHRLAYIAWLLRLARWVATARALGTAALPRHRARAHCPALHDGLVMQSAYSAARAAALLDARVLETGAHSREDLIRSGAAEPPFTCFTHDFVAALDYIFFTPATAVPPAAAPAPASAGAVSATAGAAVAATGGSAAAASSSPPPVPAMAMTVRAIGALPSHDTVTASSPRGMPNAVFASDHTPLTATFTFTSAA